MAPSPAEHLTALGQGHLVAHAAGLPPERAAAFLAEAARQPWAELVRAARHGAPPPPPELRPPSALTLRRQQAVGGLRARLAARGRQRLARGEVAALLLAGGQGTRLGHPGPKGTFVLGPDPDRSLYAILAETVAAVGREAGRPVPLVVLTSPDTTAGTQEAFAAGRRAWGLADDQVTFVEQGLLPALDPEGRALLAGPGELALAPDGHGGALPALLSAGVVDALLRRGVRVLTTFQVDNPLARPVDPVLLGWMAERGAQAVGKAVRKRSPEERVGVFARDLDGRTRVVEYTELAGVGGAEALLLGSIAVHAFDLPWVAGLAAAGDLPLPLHPARKKVACLDEHGALVAPAEPNAIKLERFLFDLFPAAARVEVQEVDRAREFAPVKNAEGDDSPATARRLVEAEVRRWHRQRGLPEPARPVLRPLELLGDAAHG